MPTNAAAPWEEVMRQLTGLRLKYYDTLTRHGVGRALAVGELEAAEWLRTHQLAFTGERDGYWYARPISAAREEWEKHGPKISEPTPQPAAQRTEPRPAVQAHQAEWFACEGYKT